MNNIVSVLSNNHGTIMRTSIFVVGTTIGFDGVHNLYQSFNYIRCNSISRTKFIGGLGLMVGFYSSTFIIGGTYMGLLSTCSYSDINRLIQIALGCKIVSSVLLSSC